MKLFKHTYTIAACCALMATASSCVNNWLDQEPSDGINAETAIQTTSDLANVRVGLYAAVKGNSTLISYYGRQMFVYGDMRGEDIQYEPENGSGRGSFYYYMTYTTEDDFTTSTAVWQMPHVVMARANRVIDAAEGGQLTDAAEEAATIAQYAAEAKVLRAMALFDLTRIYGNPYTMDNGASLGACIVSSTLESTAKPARSTVAECYAQIEKDLDDAISSGALPTEQTQGYVNEWVAKALQVRVYLTKGDWTKTLSVAEDIMNNSPYRLWTTNQYVAAWNKNNAAHENEVMFEMVINDNTDWTDRNGIAYLYAENGGVSPGYGDVIVTKAFSDSLTSDPKDVRNEVLIEPQDASSDYQGHRVYINKMPAVNSDVRYANVPLLRLSEVYLSAAEAAYEAGDKAKAAQYLNSIITNRTTDESKTVTAADLQNTPQRIYMERRKELVGEGQRYFDAMRRDETITRYTSEADRGWHDILTTEARQFNRNSKKALPLIPVGEINANPNMQQNPKY